MSVLPVATVEVVSCFAKRDVASSLLIVTRWPFDFHHPRELVGLIVRADDDNLSTILGVDTFMHAPPFLAPEPVALEIRPMPTGRL